MEGKKIEISNHKKERNRKYIMVDINPNISIIPLNMNCLNIPIIRQTERGQKKKKDSTISCF